MESAVVSTTQGVVQILLGKLSDVLAKKYALLSGVRDEIQELKDELESMTATLRDLTSSGDDEDRNEQTKTWMKQVREVGYDAEDCIDIFWHHLSKSSGDSSSLTRCINKILHLLRTLKARDTLAKEIQSLKTRAHKVSERRRRYKLDVTECSFSKTGTESHVYSRSNYLDVDCRVPTAAINGEVSRLIGIDDKTNDIIRWLDERDAPHLRVISIVGYGGLGKTTLAMTVYNNPVIRGIQSRAFVSVSQNFHVWSLLASMAKQLYPRRVKEEGGAEVDPLRDIESWDITELIKVCHDYLKKQRYLIILDDVWSPAAWEKIKIAFPNNGKGSRIIVTTRSHQVARTCSNEDHIYKMKPLLIEDSKKLLFMTVFESEECPSNCHHLKDVWEAILEKCNGLPLAIISIGGMLAQRQNTAEAEWRRVLERLGSELQMNPILEGMRRILSLSYNDLPYHLKACFLYLSVFPEDYDIRRGALVRRWEAEGFISGLHDLSPEEIAQGFFDGFVSRSLVIPGQVGSSGQVKTCKVHDIMLEVITSKSIQENFISFLGNGQYSTVGQHDKIRRLSIKPGNSEKSFSSRAFSHVRSVTILGSTETERPLPISFADLTLLRVLDLEGCRWLRGQDLKDICKLPLLRYLSLRGAADISQLPIMIGKLKGLMTLDIRETQVRDLPRSITQLQNLNHLLAGQYLYYTWTHSVKHLHGSLSLPVGFGNMKALRRISCVNISRSPPGLHEVEKLSQLTRFGVINEGDASAWEKVGKSLSKLSKSLRCLTVVHYRNLTQEGNCDTQDLRFLHDLRSPPFFLHDLHLWGTLGRIPPWIQYLANLTRVSLRGNVLGTELISTLGKLPDLVSLKLYTDSYMGSTLSFERDQFPNLRQLIVDNLRNLDELHFVGGAPKLERLTLSFVHHSRKLISGIHSLEKLREVELFGNIFESVVEHMTAMARQNPNHPRVIRDDRPTEV